MFATIKSWLRPTPPATAVRPRLGLQQLEAREVPAALLDLSGNLTVTGTAAADTIWLNNVSGQVSVTLNGSNDTIQQQFRAPGGQIIITYTSSVPAAAVRSIRMEGLVGNDNLFASAAPIGVTIDGGGGNDSLYGGAGADTLFGGEGDDGLFGVGGNDLMSGDAGHDSLFGGIGIDNLLGGDGNDQLHGERDNDTLRGGIGDDTLDGGAGDDTSYGDAGNDTLYGRSGNDFLYGGLGNDIVWGEDGNDLMCGEDGNDRLYGGAGNDNLFGNAGNDGLFGGAGTNTQAGGDGADRFLKWDGGTDTIILQEGADAVIVFRDTPTVTSRERNGSFGVETATWDPGFWTDGDVVRIDSGLDNLHRHTGNTRLLKRADGSELGGFRAVGRQTSGSDIVLGWNNSSTGEIVYVNPAARDTIGLLSTVYHEIGHNWDTAGENRHIPAFRLLSGWVQSSSSPGITFSASRGTGDDWWHQSTAAFAMNYGRWNPFEDYATTFEKYFLERYHVGPGGWGSTTPIPEKFGNLELLFSDLRS